MEIKRIKIKGFEQAPLVRMSPMMTYKAETTDGRKIIVTTTGDWKLKDVVDAIVRGLKNEH